MDKLIFNRDMVGTLENYSYHNGIQAQKICAVGAVYRKDNPEYFRAALVSVFAQSGVSFDVHLVVDGPIGEELELVLNEFSSNIHVTRLSTSLGLGLALSTVFETKIYGVYDIAIRFDSDDINYPDRFRYLVDAMIKDQLQLVGSHIHEIDGNSQIVGTRKVPLSYFRINFLKHIINPFNHPATAINVKALKVVGGYRHCYLHEDWLLWLYFLKRGFKIANIDEFLVGFRKNQGTINRRFGAKFRKYELHFYRVAIRNGLLTPILAIVGLAVRQASKSFGRPVFQLLYRQLRKHR